MSKPLRVIFDTNTFTPETFEILEKSQMRKLCKCRRIIPIYGHIFLEETLSAYANEKKRSELIQSWIPFILETVDRFCDDFEGIFHKELVQGKGRKTNIFMAKSYQNSLILNLKNIPLDGSWQPWHNSKHDRDIENDKRYKPREISKNLRTTISEWKKEVKYTPKKHGFSNLNQFVEKEITQTGKELLPKIVKCKNPHAVASRWTKNKMQYPYFTNFTINIIYMSHYAMTRPNDPIDINAQADLDLMTHLLHADALVSNETGFLRQAFEDLWRPRGKIIFTSQEFVKFTQNL